MVERNQRDHNSSGIQALIGTFPYAVYRLDTGRIVSSGAIGTSDDLKDAQIAANLAVWGAEEHAAIEAQADAESHYVGTLGGEPAVLDRPNLMVRVDKTVIEAGGIDEAVLTGLPDPCEVVIDDPDPTVETTVAEVTGGGFIFAADNPGTYTIEIRRFPFLPFKAEITAT